MADDVEVLPPMSEEELWADPRLVEGTVDAISAEADTFKHLQGYGIAAYPDGLRRFREQWARSMSRDLPRLERVARDGAISQMDREIEEPLRVGRESLPDRYAALGAKLGRLLPIMREHGFAEPGTPLGGETARGP